MAIVLVAEDDVIQRNLLLRVLRGMHHVVHVAEDGERALEMFKQEKPNLVITDIEMPNKNGLWFISEIRRSDEDLPIVAISSHNLLQLQKAKLLGADVCMNKPLNVSYLLETVDLLVSHLLVEPVAEDCAAQ